ncbi:MAG: LysM peptidoglycan-binding domain-containing protein [Clostridiaceae bacterium]|nr:LysM peptidoglycan-binding domain-containing protein [Clostridiaceae bacterium]
MSCLVQLRATAISRLGSAKTVNEDNLYVNGRFMYEHEIDNVWISIENTSDFYVFSVSDSMDVSDAERGIHISIVRELKKYHDRMLKNDENLAARTQKFYECIREISNLLTSISVSKPENMHAQSSFSGLLIQGNKACVVNMGNSKAFILSNSNMKQLTVDWEKTERLLKLGIITQEQAKILSNRFGIPTEESYGEIRKSDELTIKEGDLFLLCTDGLTDTVESETIYEILLSDKDTDVIANRLLKEAFNNNVKDSITVLVIRVEKVIQQEQRGKEPKKTKAAAAGRVYKKARKRPTSHAGVNANAMKKHASVAIFCIIVIALVLATIRLFANFRRNDEITQGPRVTNGEDYSPTSPASDDTSPGDEAPGENGKEADDVGDAGEPGTAGESTPSESTAGKKEIPGLPTTYEVKRGDTLYGISRAFYGDPEKYRIIMEANNITNPELIQVGQVLVIPSVDE